MAAVLFGNIFLSGQAQAVTRAPQAYVLPTGIQVTLERGVVDLDGFAAGESDVYGTVRIFDSGNIGSYAISLVENDNTPSWGQVYGSREWNVASFGYGPSITFTFLDQDSFGSESLGAAQISLNLDDNPNHYTNSELMGTTSITEGTNDFFYRILADRLSVQLADGEAWNTGVGILAISDIEPSIYKLLTRSMPVAFWRSYYSVVSRLSRVTAFILLTRRRSKVHLLTSNCRHSTPLQPAGTQANC